MTKTFKFLLSLTMVLIISSNMRAQTIIVGDTLKELNNRQLKEVSIFEEKQIEVDEEDILKQIDNMPAFGIYRDNYFTTGVPLNQSINKNTADALFQVSIRHRLTKSRLPFNTFLYLTYTQKSYWDIYDKSAPFRDNNYNPSLGLAKYIIHNNLLKGAAFLQIEHESNGRAGAESRSWNMISLSSKYFFNSQLTLGAKLWIPIVDGEENRDLTTYRGVGSLSANYSSKDKRWWFTGEITPRKKIGDFNTSLTAAFKISASSNQYLYVRFYDGRGENLLDYKKYNLNVRVGFCIKPDFQSIFL